MASGDAGAKSTLQYVNAELQVLVDLDGEPVEEDAVIKRVRQSKSKRYQVWRVSHPFDADVAIRLITWFPPTSNTVVVALFAGDKARIGDVWYDSVGVRADEVIRQWLFQTQEEGVGDEW